MKNVLDKQTARAIFATNTSFQYIEHLQVKKAVEILRPGYSPSSNWQISSALLEQINKEEKEKHT